MRLKEIITRKKTYILNQYIYPYTRKRDRKRLKNKDFTIISDNCWGGRVYQELGLPYLTPFIGLFVFSSDYIKLLQNLEYYMTRELSFTKDSKYGKFTYPVGIIDDIEIHFLHYLNENEALEKWNRRRERINWNNIFIKMNDSDLCTPDLINDFNSLNFRHKIFFSSKNIPAVESLVFFKELEHQKSILNGEDMYLYRKYFNVLNWLNSGITNSVNSDSMKG